MSSTVKTGVKIIRKKEHGGERIYIYLPKGVKFFGGFRHIFCRFPGVNFFTRIIYWDPDVNAIVIVIPYEQDPDRFKDEFKNRQDDLYSNLQGARKGDTFVFNGEYFIPVDE